jgi:hypothetical protein
MLLHTSPSGSGIPNNRRTEAGRSDGSGCTVIYPNSRYRLQVSIRGPARLSCYPLGGLNVHGVQSLLSVLDVKTDRIYNAVSAGKRIRD